ncbi:uncharacterized protein MKK02DRAFT_33657 [Dioszegia hungarica]|uniref:Uncharacterized protein n=1 Tax=Dioszegia hungarica TaxID=4972 RepID=A0AA38HCL1_9TREE|nr:uncharacterized protein MKK02DRAFT_33657 [Dioszegia hungarica]KAI9636459.1 hypothetical protein MKK02DRAFT_33657 [Dioszegia hungarica]
MEQQAARQAGFGESIPMQRRLPSQSTDQLGSYHSNGSASHPISYPPPAAPNQHRAARTAQLPPSAISSASTPHLLLDRSPTKSSLSASISDNSYRAGTASTAGTLPSSSSSSAGSILTYPLSPTSSAQYPWSEADWHHPDYASERGVPPSSKKEGGLKGWLKSKSSKDKGKGKEVVNKPVKEEKPVFVGGGRGGAQNRRKPSAQTSAKKSSPLVPIPESHDPVAPRPGASHSATSPLVTFTPDVQEALETLSPKPKFVGGGRGGVQNRSAKEVLLPGRASGSGKSSLSGSSDAGSSRRSFMSMGSSMREGSIGSGADAAGKKQFVGGGRGGVQNRRPKDMAGGGGLSKKQSLAVLADKGLLAGIGVSSFTVTSSEGTDIGEGEGSRNRGLGAERD